MNRVHAKAARAFQVERPVIYEKTALGRTLCDFQRDAKNRLFGLAGANVTGAEEDKEVPAQVEGFDAVVVELQRLVIDGAEKYLAERETLSRMARVSGNSLDCANMKAVNSSRLKARWR